MSGRGPAMPAMDGEGLLGRAERILALARGKTDQAEVYLERSGSLEVSVERDAVGSATLGTSMGGAWRVVQDGRLGFSYFTSDADAAAALESALRQARHAEPRRFTLPAPPRAPPLPGRWDGRVAELQVEDALGLARDVLAGAKAGLPEATVSGGGAGLHAGCMALASTEGVACWDRATTVSASASLVLEQGGRAISAGEAETRHAWDLDAGAVGAKAADTVRRLRDPQPAGKGGRRDVILRPEAVAELVCALAVEAATGDEAMRGKTVWSGRLGQPVADARISLVDDSRRGGAVGGAPFDDEGLPTARLPLVEGGVLRNYLFDCWDGHLHQKPSTASAGRGGFKSRPATTTHHLVLDGPAESLERLVAGVDDGFLVESLLGAHTANATTGEFSVTAPNVWRIRRGEVVGASREVALAGRLEEALMRIDGCSRERRNLDGADLPHLRIRGMDVSA